MRLHSEEKESKAHLNDFIIEKCDKIKIYHPHIIYQTKTFFMIKREMALQFIVANDIIQRLLLFIYFVKYGFWS